MKRPPILSLLCAAILLFVLGCGRSESEKKALGNLSLEVSRLHGDLAERLTELGKVAGQPDELLARQNAWLSTHPKHAAKFQNDDIESAKKKISTAFKAMDSWETLPSTTFEDQVKKLTHDKESLKDAISKIDDAVNAAHVAIEAHEKILASLTSSRVGSKK